MARGLPYRARTFAVQHETVAYFEDQGKLDGRHIFSVVRNPYDRAISQLVYLLRTDPLAQELFKGPTWADDLKVYAAFDGMIGHDLGACQVDWLMDRGGSIRCDRFLRFESLEEDWRQLRAELGIEDLELPHLNSMNRKVPWWEFYDDEAAAAIAKKYARDFETLNYSQELPRTPSETLGGRMVWIGGGDPPESALRLPLRTRHGRLELADGSVGTLHLYGCLEMLGPPESRKLLRECRRVLRNDGELVVNTLDLDFLTSLLPKGYEEGTLQEAFVRSYVDSHLPDVEEYAPAYVINDIMRRRGQHFLYDEALLAEFLNEAGFLGERLEGGALGEIAVRARKA